jgi:4-amino-4-deoxy-L-arabinose transferase-like glycosyltransferase
MRTLHIILLCMAVSAILGACWFWSVPLYGDASAYGLPSAKWISQNGMQLIPAGSERGEQAQGHPALYFWLWAVFIRLFGNSLMTAKILPTIAVGLALAGTWKLASSMSRDRLAGAMAAAALLASPLFLAQGFRPLSDTAFAAATVWSLYSFSRGRLLATALLCALAVEFREQGILLAGSLFLSDLISERRFRPRMLLWGIPFAVLAGSFVLNYLANGFFIDPRHLADAVRSHAPGSLDFWLGHFSGHLLGEDYRWIPISVVLALMLAGNARKLTLPVAAILLSPVLFHDSLPVAYLITLSVMYAWYLLIRRRMPSRLTLAVLLFCALMVVFFTLLTLVSPDPPHDLFRYLLGVYPGMIAILAARLLSNGRRIALPVWGIYVAATLACVGAVRRNWQEEDSLMGQVLALELREAIAASDNPYLLRPEFLSETALGYVDEPRSFLKGVRGQLVICSEADANSIPEGYSFTNDTVFCWRYRSLIVLSLQIAPIREAAPDHPLREHHRPLH